MPGQQGKGAGHAQGAETKEDSEQAEPGAALTLTDIRRQGISGSIEHAATEADQKDKELNEAFRGGEGHSLQTGQDQQRATNQHPTVTEPIHNWPKDERTCQNAERQQGGESADAIVIQVKSFREHVIDRAEGKEDDAEQEHPQTGGGENEVPIKHAGESLSFIS